MDATYPSGRTPAHITSGNIHGILGSYDTILLDCDGVLWNNDMLQTFDGIGDTIHKLRNMGKHMVFVSNHPSYTKQSLQDKFNKFCGFEAPDEDVMLISEATANYVDEEVGPTGKVYVFGSEQIRQALQKRGYDVISCETHSKSTQGSFSDMVQQLLQSELISDVKAVVLSHGAYFDYSRLFKAANYLLNPDCAFITTNTDPNYICGTGTGRRLVPTIGSLLAALEAACGRKAAIVGKPSPYYFNHARKTHPDIDPKRTVMVGDNLASDIGFARNCGLDSILVSTGDSNEQTLHDAFIKNPNIALPTYLIGGLSDIGKLV